MNFKVLGEPFPHIIGTDIWNHEDLDLIWGELNLYKSKFNTAEHYGGVVSKTNALAISYTKQMCVDSNILSLQLRLMRDIKPHLTELQKFHYSLKSIHIANSCHTKLRYYEDGHEYGTHVDMKFAYLIFSYLNIEPKKYSGGQLFFEDFDYEFEPINNSCILIPGYIAHGVRKVSIDKEYADTHSRYCISTFVDYPRK